ncbi:MAG: hypothetical protein RJQ01_11515 [Microcella sp.]|uniref:hypothetical protein n=1 Tax=Microcella sp. TaxID=1913979 RepID=UPI003315D289
MTAAHDPTPDGAAPPRSSESERARGAEPDRGSRGARVGIVLLLGFVVAWFTWDAVGNLVALPELLTQLGLAESIPWPALVLGVAMPVVAYAAAVVIGARLPLARLTLVLITSLAAVAATRLSLIAVATGTLGV